MSIKTATMDPEERKLKDLLNRKVEEIMDRYRKEKESDQQQQNENSTTNDDQPEKEVRHETKEREEKEESNEENAKPLENTSTSEEKQSKEESDENEKTIERQEISEVNTDLKADVDHFQNRTDSASTKDMIEGMPNPFADIGTLPDGPADVVKQNDINAELAAIIQSQTTNIEETNLHAQHADTQRASARDLLPKIGNNGEGKGDGGSSQVSKRGFYRYTDAKRVKN